MLTCAADPPGAHLRDRVHSYIHEARKVARELAGGGSHFCFKRDQERAAEWHRARRHLVEGADLPMGWRGAFADDVETVLKQAVQVLKGHAQREALLLVLLQRAHADVVRHVMDTVPEEGVTAADWWIAWPQPQPPAPPPPPPPPAPPAPAPPT